MVVGVGSTRTALHGIIGRYIAVRPEIERVGVPVVTQFCVCGCHHFFGLAHGQILIDDALGRNVYEIVARGEKTPSNSPKGESSCQINCDFDYILFHTIYFF